MTKVILAALLVFSINAFASPETEMQKAINQVGEPCAKVTQVFHSGNDTDGSIFVSVACSGGQNYYVHVKKSGEARVVKCAIIDKISGGRGKPGSCFSKVN